MKKRETNIEFITRLMDFSNQGALMQMFILQAVIYYSQKVEETDVSVFENTLVNGEAWKRCATECLREIEERPL